MVSCVLLVVNGKTTDESRLKLRLNCGVNRQPRAKGFVGPTGRGAAELEGVLKVGGWCHFM